MKTAFTETLRAGISLGLKTTWTLSKIIFPITVAVTFLQYTPAIGWLVRLFTPLMGWLGLPGDAAIVLALGNLLNLYAAIGAMLTMDLTVKEVFILSVMLSFSHNLLVETAITSKVGVKAWMMASIRLGLAFVSGAAIHLTWNGGAEKAQYGLIPEKQPELESWAQIAFYGLETAFIGILQLALIIIPLMVAIQFLKDWNALPYLAKGLAPFTRALGVSGNTGVTLMAGLIFGIAFGAGVIIEAAKQDQLSKKDLYLVSIFLVACHAVVEDTLLFVPLGINVLPLLLIRLIFAVVLTAVTARIWTSLSKAKSTA
jgi:hypothetical protein